MQFGTHSLQIRSLDRPMFQAQPDLIQSPRILAEAMIGRFGRFHLLLEIEWQFDLQSASAGGPLLMMTCFSHTTLPATHWPV